MARRLRMLHLISDAGPHPFFELIGSHGDRARFDIRLATVRGAGALQEDAARMGFESFALDARGRGDYPRAIVRLARRLRRDRIDVLQVHLLDGSLVGLAAARLARTQATVFTGHHSHEIPLHHRRALIAVDRLCAGPLSDAIIAPSRQMAETLVGVHRVRAEKIEIIPHGFELARLEVDRVAGSGVRTELGLDGKVVLGSVGRLYWIKNQEALVRAFASIVPQLPEAVLLLVGGGDPEPVRELARELGVAEKVLVVPPRDDIPAVLAAMDLFVHPALAESFGMVIIEAMAMGLPIVSTPVGIAADVVEDGVTGVRAAGGAPRDLERALTKAVEQRDRWKAMGEESRRRALGFSAADMVRAYESTYLALIDRAPRWRAGRA